MSLALFNSVPAGAIETVFDDQNQPWFKRADLGRYLGIVKVKNSMHIPSHFMCKRQDGGLADSPPIRHEGRR